MTWNELNEARRKLGLTALQTPYNRRLPPTRTYPLPATRRATGRVTRRQHITPLINEFITAPSPIHSLHYSPPAKSLTPVQYGPPPGMAFIQWQGMALVLFADLSFFNFFIFFF